MDQNNDETALKKLKLALQQVVDNSLVDDRRIATTRHDDILISNGSIEKRLEVIERFLFDNPKTIKSTKKVLAEEATTPDEGFVETTTTATAKPRAKVTPKKVEAPAGKKWNNNKLLNFKDTFAEDPEFRERFLNDEIRAEIAAEVPKKTTDAQLKADATKCYNYYKNKDLLKVIIEDFETRKKQFEAANQPPQQEVEPRTPVKEGDQ